MTLEFRSIDTGYIKQWPNWTGEIPQKGDIVILGEDRAEYDVLYRKIDGTQSDKVIIIVKQL